MRLMLLLINLIKNNKRKNVNVKNVNNNPNQNWLV